MLKHNLRVLSIFLAGLTAVESACYAKSIPA